VTADQQTMLFVGIWLAMEFAFHGLGLLSGQGQIAWQAHLGGFVTGLLLMGPLMQKPKPPSSGRQHHHLTVVD
jgi:membrane associated rhomboid family serine protease